MSIQGSPTQTTIPITGFESRDNHTLRLMIINREDIMSKLSPESDDHKILASEIRLIRTELNKRIFGSVSKPSYWFSPGLISY
jgi:hypothetical protein